VALFPCKHFALCDDAECARMLGSPRKCPVCRKKVKKIVRMFVS
jgi:hypothetical protein